jgi:hypothetical protein
LYREWKNGGASEIGIRQKVGANDRKHTISFDTFLLERIASGVQPTSSEEGKNCALHSCD